jgi:hypothetical protein
MLTPKTTGIDVVKILMPHVNFPFTTKIKVYRYVISTNRIIRPKFYEGTLDPEGYINGILNTFFVDLAPAEQRFGYFIDDSTHSQRNYSSIMRCVWQI